MGYLVLARKYRPQTFAEMTGQEHVVRTLSNALRSGQLAHAFLFTGPRGVGKTTAARLVAKAVNCEQGPTATPCGRCAACVEIAEGRAVDVVEIDAASNNGVDNVRDIVEAVKYRPARDRHKVFVVDEVHMLSTGAFNALLKTLEEPPPHVLFVLATTDIHRVPETIVSRCQRFDFRRLTLQQIVAQLRKVVDAEGMQLTDSALALLARAAEGGMRDALSLLDRVRAACGEAADDASVAEAVGAIDSAAVARIGWGLVRRDGAALLAEIEALYQRGQEMKRVAEELVRHLRNLTLARLVPSVPLDLPEVERKEVEAQAAAAEPAQLARLFDIAQRAVGDVKVSEQPRYALEVALLKGALLAPGAEVSDLVARIERMATQAPHPDPLPASGEREKSMTSFGSPGCAAGVVPASIPSPPQGERARVRGPDPAANAPHPDPLPASGERERAGAASVLPTSRDDPSVPVPERWRAAVTEMEKASPSTAAALKQGALLWIRDGEVGVQFAAGSSFAGQAERKRAEVERVFAAFFGRPTRLTIQTGASPAGEALAAASIASVERAEREARSSQVRDTARNHPNIQEAAKVLGAEISKIEEL